jgi:hypothetical protein
MNLRNPSKLVLAVVLATLLVDLVGCAPKNVVKPDKSPSRVSQFQTKGNLNLAGATFLALTTFEVASAKDNDYQFKVAFPTKTQADITLRMIPNQKYTPTAEERALSVPAYQVGLDHSLKGDSYRVILRYFLPQKALTTASKVGTRTALSPKVAFASDSPESGIMVELTAAIVEGGKQILGALEQGVVEGLLGIKDQNPFGTTLDSGLSVVEALNMSIEYQEMVAQLDELQAEAENPTNPLTQKAYAEDPSVKQMILDEIADARAQIKMDCLVDYLNTEVSVAIGLLSMARLSIAVAPITAWNSKTIKQVMRERISNVRKMITRGIFSTKPRSETDSSVDTGSYSPPPELPPGTWTVSYEYLHLADSGVDKTTHNEKGTMTFTVGANFQITGTGGGHRSTLVLFKDGSRTDVKGDYTFIIEGIAFLGILEALSFSSISGRIEGYSTTSGKSVPISEAITSFPILPEIVGKDLKLQSGESLVEEETYFDGADNIVKRVLIIK